MGFITSTEISSSRNGDLRDHTRIVFYHGLWWLSFILYEISIYYFTAMKAGNLVNTLMYYAINIAVFYTHLYILEHTLRGEKKNYFRMILLVGGAILVFVTIKVAIDYYHTDFRKYPVPLLEAIKGMAALDIYRTIFFTGLASLYWTASHLSDAEHAAKEAEIKQLKESMDGLVLKSRLANTENALLRQQMNPHLLFNSLNFIHSGALKVSEDAAETVVLLADILRFSMEEPDADGKILLSAEISQIKNLIDINRKRFEKTSRIEFSVTGIPDRHRIIPLVLVTLVENIFKHGNFVDHSVSIRLDISEDGLLNLLCKNKVKAKGSHRPLKSTGIQNIRIRLNYTYGEGYELKLNEENQIFETSLILQL